MSPMQKDMEQLRRQLKRGAVQKAYRALLDFMAGLRTRFAQQFGESGVSGLYAGRMDMTYFALHPPALRSRDLKVAIVFNYDAFRFEAWLAARNRKLQRQYWELFKDSPWTRYRLVTPAEGIDSILECDLAADFDLDAPHVLTSAIEQRTARFVEDVERFLEKHQNDPTLVAAAARHPGRGARTTVPKC